MGAYRGMVFTQKIKVMKSLNKRDAHVKVKICGNADKSLEHKIRLLIESYNKQSDQKVSYKIIICRDHRP